MAVSGGREKSCFEQLTEFGTVKPSLNIYIRYLLLQPFVTRIGLTQLIWADSNAVELEYLHGSEILGSAFSALSPPPSHLIFLQFVQFHPFGFILVIYGSGVLVPTGVLERRYSQKINRGYRKLSSSPSSISLIPWLCCLFFLNLMHRRFEKKRHAFVVRKVDGEEEESLLSRVLIIPV